MLILDSVVDTLSLLLASLKHCRYWCPQDILGADVDEAPAAAAPGASGSAAAPPPLPSNAAAAGGGKQAPRGGLLAQIRAGVQLSRVDVEKLKAQRKKERLQTARQSVRMMQSLEDTLRQALEMRNLEMNPGLFVVCLLFICSTNYFKQKKKTPQMIQIKLNFQMMKMIGMIKILHPQRLH